MIFLILVILALTMIVVLLMDKTWTKVVVAGTHIGLIMVIFSYALIWLKNGGIGDTMWYVFALNPGMKRKLLYYPISATSLSTLLLFGKSLFLGFSILTAVYISQPLNAIWNRSLIGLAAVVSMANFVLLYPGVLSLYYRKAFFVENQILIFNFIRCIYLLCVVLCVALMMLRFRNIRVRWVRKRFSYIIPCMLNLHFLFIIFAVLGPIQVSHFTGIYYIHSNLLYLSKEFWVVLLIISILCICVGSQALWSYSKYVLLVETQDLVINKKLKESDMSVKMLNHGMKNQLLVLRGMLRDFKEDVNLSLEETEKVEEIQGVSEEIISRMDEIYHAFIKKALLLTELESPQILVEEALARLRSEVAVEIEIIDQRPVLADYNYLVEAIYNVLKNSVDSIEHKKGEEQHKITIKLYTYGKYMVFEIIDTGEGIPLDIQKKVFEPFYTSKNSKHNWGIGLTYTYQIIKAHFGKIHMESKVGIGTSVSIMIPTYRI